MLEQIFGKNWGTKAIGAFFSILLIPFGGLAARASNFKQEPEMPPLPPGRTHAHGQIVFFNEPLRDTAANSYEVLFDATCINSKTGKSFTDSFNRIACDSDKAMVPTKYLLPHINNCTFFAKHVYIPGCADIKVNDDIAIKYTCGLQIKAENGPQYPGSDKPSCEVYFTTIPEDADGLCPDFRDAKPGWGGACEVTPFFKFNN